MKYKSKVTLLALTHNYSSNDTRVDRGLDEFKKHVKPGKTLYIEWAHEELKSLGHPIKPEISGYYKLVNYAREHGMNVVGLDTERIGKIWRRLFFKAGDIKKEIHDVAKKLNIPLNTVDILGLYVNQPLRERRWARILSKAKEGDIAVMSDGHAYNIAPKISINRKKIVDCQKNGTPWHEYMNELKRNQMRYFHWRKMKNLQRLREALRKERRSKMK